MREFLIPPQENRDKLAFARQSYYIANIASGARITGVLYA